MRRRPYYPRYLDDFALPHGQTRGCTHLKLLCLDAMAYRVANWPVSAELIPGTIQYPPLGPFLSHSILDPGLGI
jgi:hypothetical protein